MPSLNGRLYRGPESCFVVQRRIGRIPYSSSQQHDNTRISLDNPPCLLSFSALDWYLLLSRYARQKRPLTLRVTDAEQEHPLELPAGAITLLMDILEAMADGRGITLMPENAERSTMRAAEVLNV